MADKQCKICGKMMYGVRIDKQYCSRHCQREAAKKRMEKGIDINKKICAKCGKEFTIIDNGYTRRYCFECVPLKSYNNGASMRKIIKQWALEYKGNKCQCCGYDRCVEALDFHHYDSDNKEFNISDRDIKLNWQEIKEELDKCILVCANCHREIHNGIRDNMGREINEK